MDLGVIGQRLVGLGHGGGQFFVAAVRAMRPKQCMVTWHGFAVDEGLSDVSALESTRPRPTPVDVAPETADELMLLAPFEVEMASASNSPRSPLGHHSSVISYQRHNWKIVIYANEIRSRCRIRCFPIGNFDDPQYGSFGYTS